jgi:hypothetical protein
MRKIKHSFLGLLQNPSFGLNTNANTHPSLLTVEIFNSTKHPSHILAGGRVNVVYKTATTTRVVRISLPLSRHFRIRLHT